MIISHGYTFFAKFLIMDLIKKLKKNINFRKNRNRILKIAREVFPQKIVSDGPFKGLKYPEYISCGSAIYSKLLGTYEAELHDFIYSILRQDLEILVDIGCAEGYYAVGFAILKKNISVYAFDISEFAQNLCRQMAIYNGVVNRIKISGITDKEYLLNLPKDKKGLIIIDCEGAEEHLIDQEVLNRLSNWNFIIELHEFIVRGIEKKIIDMISRTHQIEVIDSIDDYRRPDQWPKKNLRGVDFEDQKELYKEGRPGMLRWVCAIPKH